MPVDPVDALQLGQSISEILAASEARLVELVGGTLVKGIDSPDWDVQALQRVQDLAARLRDALKVMETEASPEIRRAILDAWQAGADQATADLEALTTPVIQGPAIRDAALLATQNLITEATQTVGQMAVQAAFSASRIYADTARQVVAEATSGAGVTRRDLAGRLLERLAARGVTAFTDRAGRRWDMNSYAEMVTRTTTAQAMVSGHVDQLHDSRHDLVMCSDAPAECSKCRPFEGQVLTITGQRGTQTVDGVTFLVIDTVEGARRRGLFHPNCRHRLVAFIPGITERLTDTEDPEGDRVRQLQRAHERGIRKIKRELIIREQLHGKGSRQAKETRAQLRERQSVFKAFRDDHGLKDLSYRTRVDIGNVKRGPSSKGAPAGPTPPLTPDPPATSTAVVQPRPSVPDENLPTKKRGRRTPPEDMREWNATELKDAGDFQLDTALRSALEADHPGTDRLLAEIDRREQAPFLAQAKKDLRAQAARARREKAGQAQADEIQRLIAGGEDPRIAVESVTGVTVERQLRTELLYRLKSESVPGRTLDQMLRNKYRQESARLYVAAEDATRGQMLSREAENLNTVALERGLKAPHDPARFFTGANQAYVRRWASAELREWFDVNGFPTFDEYRHQQLTGTATHGRPIDDFLT